MLLFPTMLSLMIKHFHTKHLKIYLYLISNHHLVLILVLKLVVQYLLWVLVFLLWIRIQVIYHLMSRILLPNQLNRPHLEVDHHRQFYIFEFISNELTNTDSLVNQSNAQVIGARSASSETDTSNQTNGTISQNNDYLNDIQNDDWFTGVLSGVPSAVPFVSFSSVAAPSVNSPSMVFYYAMLHLLLNLVLNFLPLNYTLNEGRLILVILMICYSEIAHNLPIDAELQTHRWWTILFSIS